MAAGLTGKNVTILESSVLRGSPRPAPSDTVRFGIIGTGTQGCDLLRASRAVPGIECVAAADLYDTRHESAKEVLNKNIDTTREYRRILDRTDDIRVSAAAHGPVGARRYDFLPTYFLRGLARLTLDLTPAPVDA